MGERLAIAVFHQLDLRLDACGIVVNPPPHHEILRAAPPHANRAGRRARWRRVVGVRRCSRGGDLREGAPNAVAKAPRFVGDIGRQEQVAVECAALGIAAGDVVEDVDGHAPSGEAGKGSLCPRATYVS